MTTDGKDLSWPSRQDVLRAGWVGLSLAILCTFGISGLDRQGYSPDEEITAVMVSAISESGLPLLPSGILYNRGLPFLYLAWAVGAFGGDTLASYRLASLLCGLLGIIVAFLIGLRMGGVGPAVLLSSLLATFPAFVAVAVFARQYSALLASALCFIWIYWKPLPASRTPWFLLLALGCTVLLHPLGVALLALPVIDAVSQERSRPANVRLAIQCAAIVGASLCVSYGLHVGSLLSTSTVVSSQTAIYALPRPALPGSHVTALADGVAWTCAVALFVGLAFLLDRLMPRSRGVILACAITGLVFHLGAMVALAAVGVLIKPSSARRWLVCAGVMMAASIAFWTGYAALRTDAQFSWNFAKGLTDAALHYPFGLLRYTATAWPAGMALACLGALFAACRPTDTVARRMRSLSATMLVTLLMFDVASVPVNERYVVLPWTLLAIVAVYGAVASAQLLVRVLTRPIGMASVTRYAAVALAGVWLFIGNYQYAEFRREGEAPTLAVPIAAVPVTGATWRPELMRHFVQPTDAVVCTEELACLYLLGRVDFLLALPPADSAHYVASRLGASLGFYAGSPVISTEAQLRDLMRSLDPRACAAIVTLNTGKVGFYVYNDLIVRVGRSFDHRLLFSNREAHVSRLCTPSDRESHDNARAVARQATRVISPGV